MQTVLKIEGMTCGGCVRSVEKALGRVAGVSSTQVDLAQGKAMVEADNGLDPSALVAAVEDAGYDARIAG
jgi:copper ion binding protein